MILIVDNGSQYTHLIGRRCRELDFSVEIINNRADYAEVKDRKKEIEKIILSGGPSSVYLSDNGLSVAIVKKVAAEELNVPLLGICFGHQLIAHVLGGKVEKGKKAEYGLTKIKVDIEDVLFKGVPKEFNAWESHYDEVKKTPEGFVVLAHSEVCAVEAMANEKKKMFGVQFHPEVWHTENGERIIGNFLSFSC